MDSISSLWHLWVVSALLVIIAVGFLFNFVIPAVRLKGHLAVAIDGLKTIKERSGGVVLDLTEIAEGPMHTSELAHSWSEYTETLHPQRKKMSPVKSESFGGGRLLSLRCFSLNMR
jgi:hypothetical protein